MAHMIGAVFGALMAMFLVSRATLWLFKRLGDRPARILTAHAVACGAAVILGGFGFANGGPPAFGYAASFYVLPTLVWLAVDLLGWKGRAAKAPPAADLP